MFQKEKKTFFPKPILTPENIYVKIEVDPTRALAQNRQSMLNGLMKPYVCHTY